MSNGVAPNCWYRASYVAVLLEVDTSFAAPCPTVHQEAGVGLGQWATGVGKLGDEVELKGIKQDLMPYVGQLEFASIPIDG